MTQDQKYACSFIAFIIFVLAITIGGWILKSKMEAETFSKLTGKPVTTWEAMWVELRVQEPAKE